MEEETLDEVMYYVLGLAIFGNGDIITSTDTATEGDA